MLLFQPEENDNVLKMDVTEIQVEPRILLKATKPTQIPALNLWLFLLSFTPALYFSAAKCVLLSYPSSLCDGKFCITGAGQKRSCGATRTVIKFQTENDICQLYKNIQTFMMYLASMFKTIFH